MLLHAHPDDESIGTGATMARYAAEGARVTLVTCTLGELGERFGISRERVRQLEERAKEKLRSYCRDAPTLH